MGQGGEGQWESCGVAVQRMGGVLWGSMGTIDQVHGRRLAPAGGGKRHQSGMATAMVMCLHPLLGFTLENQLQPLPSSC